MSVFFENELDTEIPAHYQDIVEDIIEASLDFLKCPYECEFCENSPLDYFNQDTGELMLGDIILNVDRIAEQAEEYGHTRRREVAFLTAHSMLHLAGYDHIDDSERLHMEKLQEEILTKKGYTRDNEEE